MDNFQQIDPRYMAMLQAGLGILAANNGRQPAGAAIGQGLLGGTNAYQQNLLQQQEAALRQQQMDMQKQEFGLKQKEYDQKIKSAADENKMNNQILQSLGIGILPSQTPDSAPIDYNILSPQQPAMPSQQPQGMSRDSLYKLGVARSLTGGHGGDALLKYADMNKPNWQNVGNKLVDTNQYQGEIPVSPAPMSESDKARGAFEGWLPPQPNISTAPSIGAATSKQPQPTTNKQPSGYVYNPNLSPKANQELLTKDESAKIDEKYKNKNKGLSVAAQKELIDAEDGIQGSKEAVKAFGRALAINNKAIGGFSAGTLATAGSILPDIVRPEALDATKELDNILQGAALPQLKAIFGGMPTEGERAILLEVQGASSQNAKVREGIFNRAIEAANNRIKYNTEKAKQLRNGTYFTEEGGINVTKDAPIVPNDGKIQGQREYTSLPKKAAKGEIVKNPITGERKRFNGLTWVTIK